MSSEPLMDNSGHGVIIVPGRGCPIDYEIEPQNRFTHGANDWIQSLRLTVRELSMLKVMDALTDKSDWNKKVFDDEIARKWGNEAMQKPLISENAWAWCLKELQDKALTYNGKGFIPVYNTGSGCIKSDSLVPESLRNELVTAVRPLVNAMEKDWHPNSNEQMLNLVHPSLFPLVYGQSRVMKTGQVGLDNFLDFYGKGEVIPSVQEIVNDRTGQERWSSLDRTGRWSTKFQWLPCEVAFEGRKGTDVKITSYINNLHPNEHGAVYEAIERILSLAIQPFNEVLIEDNKGRTAPRIKTYGAAWDYELPESQAHEDAVATTSEYLALPDRPNVESGEYDDGVDDEDDDDDDDDDDDESIRNLVHPDAGEAYSFEDWKAGRTDGAVVGPRGYGGSSHDYYYSIELEEEFRSQGLQVIVKLASIELNPEKPEYPGGNWHIEGMLNEHIAATAIYYYDVENVTESRISFRQEADLEDYDMHYEQDEHRPLCEIFGVESLRNEPAVQELGSIATPQGRLLVFPNTLQHRVQPFRLSDATRSGHRRFLVLWLVDPHYRILSTRNVPPQRHDWWRNEALQNAEFEHKLPAELTLQVIQEIGEWPMGMEEAKKLRLELMAERTNLMPTIEADMGEYNFCEH